MARCLNAPRPFRPRYHPQQHHITALRLELDLKLTELRNRIKHGAVDEYESEEAADDDTAGEHGLGDAHAADVGVVLEDHVHV